MFSRMRYIDLHVHSRSSDGSDTPAALAALAAESGLAAVALTDHDTVGGVPEFLEAARAFPQLEAIAGVEISTAFSSRELHIVGLFVDHANPQLGEFLGEMRRNREIRNEAIRIKLNSLGYPLTWDHLERSAFAFPIMRISSLLSAASKICLLLLYGSHPVMSVPPQRANITRRTLPSDG